MSHQTKKRIGAVIVSIVAIIQAVALSGNGIVLLEASDAANPATVVTFEQTSEETAALTDAQEIKVTAENKTDSSQEIRLQLTDATVTKLDDITAVLDKYPTEADGTQIAVRWNNNELLAATDDTFTVTETIDVDAGKNAADADTEATVTEETATAAESTSNIEETAETTTETNETEDNTTADNTAAEAAENTTEQTAETAAANSEETTEANSEETAEAAEENTTAQTTTEVEVTDAEKQYITFTLPANTQVSFKLKLTTTSTTERNLTVTAESYQEGSTENLLKDDEDASIELVWGAAEEDTTSSSATTETADETAETTNPEQSFNGSANGIIVKATAPEGALPANTTMKVTKVSDEEVLAEAIAATDAAHAKAVAVDISFYDADGNEIEPQAPIQVTMTADEIAENDEVAIVHVDDENNASVMETTEENKDDTLAFESDAFSTYAIVYTVDFAYGEYTYSIEGGSNILLSKLLKQLQITDDNGNVITVDDVKTVSFSDETLVKVTAENGDWKLESLKAFDTDETLTLTLTNGDVVEIQVTDAQSTTGVTIFFDKTGGSRSWSSKSSIYLYFYGGTSGGTWVEMSTMEIDGKAYYYYTFTEDVSGFLLCTQKNFNNGRDQTQNVDSGISNGNVYVLNGSSTSSAWATLRVETTISNYFTSHAGETIYLVDMTGGSDLEDGKEIVFTNSLGTEEKVNVSNGSITIPKDDSMGIPFTSFKIGDLEISLTGATTGVSGTYSSSTNTFYYGATTSSDGKKVIASYWGSSITSSSLSGKTLYFDTNYSFQVNGESKSLTPDNTIGANTVYTYTFDSNAYTDTILSVSDGTNTYHFYWTDPNTYDLVVVDDDTNLASVSSTHSTLAGTAISDENGLKGMSSGVYYLTNDITAGSTIEINGDVTLDLNGHRITTSTHLFTINNGGSLTITDSSEVQSNVSDADDPEYDSWSESGTVTVNDKNIEITYYVTESSEVIQSNYKGTTEKTYLHDDCISGSIITSAGVDEIIQVKTGGTFNLADGAITPGSGQSLGHLVLNQGTFNMTGGYLAGASTSDGGGGAAVYNYKDSDGQGIMNMSGGVIANNSSSNNGGAISNVRSATLNVSGGIISGNSSASGYNGGAIYSESATVNISGGYITNNTANGSASFSDDSAYGGGGIAFFNGKFTMTGGYVTRNTSENAGGGIYIGNWDSTETYEITGGIIAQNLCYVGEGGGLRVSNNASGSISGYTYITNNQNWTGYGQGATSAAGTKNSGTWGGGGVFVQQGGTLTLYAALITDNTAEGYGGGFAACPTGDVDSVSNDGAAIFGNTAKQWHMSSTSGHGKNKDLWLREGWTDYGYGDAERSYFQNSTGSAQDYFSAGVASVAGFMLGDTAANWSGMINYNSVSIGKYDTSVASHIWTGKKIQTSSNTWEEVDAAYVGLTAAPTPADQVTATSLSTVVISGNYSYTHGGGVMTNGTVKLGTVPSEKYPDVHLTGIKALSIDGTTVSASNLLAETYSYRFEVSTGSIGVNNGEIVYFLDEDNAQIASMTDGGGFKLNWSVGSEDLNNNTATYYMVEINDSADDTEYDETVYRIQVTLNSSTTSVGNTAYHTISSITITKASLNDAGTEINWTPVSNYKQTINGDYSASIDFSSAVFTNIITHSYELPVTGGPGTAAMAMGGFALVAAGTLTKYKKKRRNERRIRD